MNNKYVNLRLGTSYSLGAGIAKTSEVVNEIANNPDLYSPYLCISNRNMAETTSMFKTAKSKGIEPIAAVEIDIIHVDSNERLVKEAFDTRTVSEENKVRHSMLFIAKSFRGYQTLAKLQTLLHTKSENVNKKGILEHYFSEYPDLLQDVFVLSGGLNSGEQAKPNKGSYLFQQFKQLHETLDRIDTLENMGRDAERLWNDVDNYQNKIEEHIRFWRDASGGNYFVELQRQGVELEEEFIQYIVPIANQLGVPIIATHNTYFLKPEDYVKHEQMLAYRDGYSIYLSQDKMKTVRTVHSSKDNYLLNNDEMAERFKDLPEALNNTVKLAETCRGVNLKPIPDNTYHMPVLQSDNPDETIDMLFERMSREGLDKVIMYLFKKYGDINSVHYKKDWQPADGDFKRDQSIPTDNAYFTKFKEWTNLNLSLETHTPDEILSKLKETNLYGEYEDRLNYEIGVIKKMQFSSYFVIVADMVQYAKSIGMNVGLGRGSGAGSLVAYALQITDLDPLQFGLFFERFLNPDRISMPDFDIDFPPDQRPLLVQYLINKYNKLATRMNEDEQNSSLDKMLRSPAIAKILTLSEIGGASGLGLAGNVIGRLSATGGLISGIKQALGNKATETDTYLMEELEEHNWNIKGDFFTELAKNPTFNIHMMYGQTFNDLIIICDNLTGQISAFGSHAAGIIINPNYLDDVTPILVDSDNNVVIQNEMKYAESLGLIKYDALGLLTLTYISEVLKEINITRRRQGLPEWSNDDLMNEINIYDKDVYRELFAMGDTSNIFQFESKGMMEVLKQINITCFEELVAAVALYRPGPMDSIPAFAANKKDPSKIVDLAPSTPRIKEILAETYGFPVYQEQIMELFQVGANFTLGQADLVRRAMGKKDHEELKRQEQKFLDGYLNRLQPEIQSGKFTEEQIRKEAEDLFTLIKPFADYGFNKSHAAAYAKTSFITGWLKHHYKKEFYVAYLNVMVANRKKNDIPKLISSAHKDGIPIASYPTINDSYAHYTLNKNGVITLPLTFGISNNLKLQRLLDVRAQYQENTGLQTFPNIFAFLNACKENGLSFNLNEMKQMIRSGVFDCFDNVVESHNHTLQHATSTHEMEIRKGRNYAELMINADKLVQYQSISNDNSSNSHYLYKYFPTRFLNIKPSKNNEPPVLEEAWRPVPKSQQYTNRVSVFGYWNGFVESQDLLTQYAGSLKDKGALSIFQNANTIKNPLSIGFDSLFTHCDTIEKQLVPQIIGEWVVWKNKHSKELASHETKLSTFYSNAKTSFLTVGIVVNYKKSKEAIDLYIQLDNGQIIHQVLYNDKARSTKFELMTPYVFKVSASLDRDNFDSDTMYELTKALPEMPSNLFPVSWYMTDFFSLDNVLKQLSGSAQKPEKLPQLTVANVNDVDEADRLVLSLLYKSHALSSDTELKHKDKIEFYNEKEVQLVEYKSHPIDVRLPSGEVIGMYFNDFVSQNLLENSVSIKLNMNPMMLTNNHKLQHNALEGNMEAFGGMENIRQALVNNEAFNQVLPYVDCHHDFPESGNSSEQLIYGYLKQVYRNRKDDEYKNNLDKLIVVLADGRELTVNARFGRLAQEHLKSHELKQGQVVLLKTSHYHSAGKGHVFNLLDFYTEEHILNMVDLTCSYKLPANQFFDYAQKLVDNQLVVQEGSFEQIKAQYQSMTDDEKANHVMIRSEVLDANKVNANHDIQYVSNLTLLVQRNDIVEDIITNDAKVVMYSDTEKLKAYHIPPLHEIKSGSMSYAYQQLHHSFDEHHVLNTQYLYSVHQTEPEKRICGKNTNGLQSFDDVFEAPINEPQAIYGVLVRVEENRFGSYWHLMGQHGVFKLKAPNSIKEEFIQPYLEGGEKYGEPLVFSMKCLAYQKKGSNDEGKTYLVMDNAVPANMFSQNLISTIRLRMPNTQGNPDALNQKLIDALNQAVDDLTIDHTNTNSNVANVRHVVTMNNGQKRLDNLSNQYPLAVANHSNFASYLSDYCNTPVEVAMYVAGVGFHNLTGYVNMRIKALTPPRTSNKKQYAPKAPEQFHEPQHEYDNHSQSNYRRQP